MKNMLLGFIAFLLMGIFVFLGMIYFTQDAGDPEEISAESQEETSSDEHTDEDKTVNDKETETEDSNVEETSASMESEDKKQEDEEGSNPSGKTDDASDAASLEKELDKLDLTVEDEDYIIQDTQYKNLYPDMLSAVIKNGSNIDIKDMVYGFVAWDKNGLPVKLKGDIDFSSGSYFHGGTAEAINVAPGETHGRDYGFGIDSDIDNIDSLKAVAVSYTGFNGEEWENPLLDDFMDIYEGKRLEDIEGHENFIHFINGSSTKIEHGSIDSSDAEGASSDLETAAENFILDYYSQLESAYAENDFSYIEPNLRKGSKSYNVMLDNVQNQRFPNLTIRSAEVVTFNEEGNNIYLEVTSERTNDNLNGYHVFKTGYELTYSKETGTFTIESYTDL